MSLTIRGTSNPAASTVYSTSMGLRVGIAICEDFWNDKTFWRQRLYQNDPAQELIELHPGLLVSINASPFNKGKMAVRCEMVSHRAKSAKLPIIFVNLIGGNDGVIFDGASIISDASGKIIMQAPPFAEFIGTVDLDCGVADSRCLTGDEVETIRAALVLGIRDYARKNNFTKAVLGLSGGIDSALVAALAAEALGGENVLAVTMPSPYSSRGSVDDSLELARRLAIKSLEKPIGEAFHVLRNELGLPEPDVQNKTAAERAVENLQSRLRGNILMTISNAENRLLLSTGNKSELALGYARCMAIPTAAWRLSATCLKRKSTSSRGVTIASAKLSPNRSSVSRLRPSSPPDNSTRNLCRLTTSSIRS